jgi:Xaa-Pro aminopeptidase
MDEFNTKLKKILDLVEIKNLDGVILNTQKNFSWITCGGDDHVVYSSDIGVASIIITPSRRILLCKNIEKNRLIEEELNQLEFEVAHFPWHANLENEIKKIMGDAKFGSDTNFSIRNIQSIDKELMNLRLNLVGDEIRRAKELGRLTAKIFENSCKDIKRNMMEFEIAGSISKDLLEYGIYPAVLLIAVDDRVFKYRHPIPTTKKLDTYVMAVIVAKKFGLHIALTRFLHFGQIPPELKKKLGAVAYIDAGLINNSIPGTESGKAIRKAIEDYKNIGYVDEWKLHHQGGAIGYQPREYIASPDMNIKIVKNGLMAWNPSITGVKSEDTILVQEQGNKILTQTDDWPLCEVIYRGKKYLRPDILIK